MYHKWEDAKDGAAHFRAQFKSSKYSERGNPDLHSRINQTSFSAI